MGIDAVDRTVAILEQLAERPDGMGIARLAERVGMAPSTLHRYLSSLQEHELVEQESDRSYRLTSRLYLLGIRATDVHGLERRSRAHLESLAAATRETVCLMVRDGESAVCVAQAGGDHHQLKIEARIGGRSDLRLGATARVLLAFAPESLRETLLARPPLKRRTANTVTEPSEIRDLLNAIRRDGHYVSQSQVDDGVMAVAAPVRDRLGEVIAAVAVVAPETRMAEGPVLTNHVRLLKEEVARLSEGLGYTEGRRFVTGREVG